MNQTNHFDVLIVGAGISGIGAAVHLSRKCPTRTFAILEGRENIGGTWDLFKYPGIRSDSDMHTMGYGFKPWRSDKAIADGPSILAYVSETADEYAVADKIRFNHRVTHASWATEEGCWTVHAEVDEGSRFFTASFLLMCSGYYNYDKAYDAHIPGIDEFQGPVIHPQFWDEDCDYEGKQVVVVGSGATAVTLVPELAKSAGHVTMLQRSPTYMVSAPDEDRLSNRLKAFLAPKLAYGLTRWKNILFGTLFYNFCQRFPDKASALLKRGVAKALGPSYDVDTHFTPRYKPWDQRMCLVPNGDFFEAVRAKRASVVTDHIERITATGIQLKSGKHIDADLIVTATGLELAILSNIDLSVDGKKIDPGNCLAYKSLMLSDVPNLIFTMGYTNASWTLKCDLTSEYAVRLLNFMERRDYGQVTARLRDVSVEREPMLNLTSGYVTRSAERLPKQGHKAPWKLRQNYLLDILTIRFKPLEDDALEFVSAERAAAPIGEAAA